MTADRTAALEAALKLARWIVAHPNNQTTSAADVTGVILARALLSTAKEADRMREALRKLAIQSVGQLTHGLGIIHTGWTCELCKQDWDRGQPEKHDPDCAALLPSEGTKP